MRYSLSVHTVSVEEIIKLLDAVPSVSDEDLRDAYDRLLVSMNADGAALGYFAAAARICCHRPHLVARVLGHPINALICLGFETSEQVLGYLSANTREGVWFQKQTGPEGIAWLINEVPKMKDLLDRLLLEEMQENLEEYYQSIPRTFPPIRLIPASSIEEAHHLVENESTVEEDEVPEVETRHRLGGEPGFIQPEEFPRCPQCGRIMVFYGQLDSVGDVYHNIDDDGMIYVFLCFIDFKAVAIVHSEQQLRR